MVAPVSEVLCSTWADVGDVPAAVLAELHAQTPPVTDDQINDALLRASELLWALSGRVWYGGGCTETAILRSNPPPPGTGSWPYDDSWKSCRCWSYGTWIDGRLFPGFGYPDRHVAAPIAVKLPRSPVTGITSVTVDGSPFAAWRLLPTGWLERTDGKPWQVCDGDTEIVYTFGMPPPAGGRDAAVELGVELLRYRLKIKGCRLPSRTTSITRQGLSMEIVDPMEFLESGGTGLLGVDMWLRSVNPHRNPQAARVWSPDLPTTIRM
jgi:hypothetical protein